MKKQLEVIRYNRRFTGKYIGQTYEYLHSMNIVIEGEPQLLATIANDITDSLWTDFGYGLLVVTGGKQYRNRLRIFIMQNGLEEYRHRKVRYSQAVLAIYGILASYGVKIQ